MERITFTIKATVSKIGSLEEYIDLPVVKDEVAVGVIKGAIETELGYELEILIWGGTGVEFLVKEDAIEPSSVHIGFRAEGCKIEKEMDNNDL